MDTDVSNSSALPGNPWYGKVDMGPSKSFSLHMIDSQTWLMALSGLVVLLVSTRFLSGLRGQSVKGSNGANTVPMAPYWIPVIGHLLNMALMPDSLFDWARKVYRKGVFSLYLAGTTHNFVFKPALGLILMNQKTEIADAEHVSKRLMQTNFGFPSKEGDKYDAALADILSCYKYLLSEPSLGTMVGSTLNMLKHNIGSLVTFTASQVDHNQWERMSNVDLVTLPNGEQVVEASLLPLIKYFVAFTANPSLMGTDFCSNFPDYWTEVWKMDKGFFHLATGLPRWFPVPTLTRAHIALRNMLCATTAMHEALERKYNGQDPGTDWQDLDDLPAIMKARMNAYRKHNFSIAARAACETALTWAMNANANPFVFWLLNRIYADPVILEQIREEVSPYIHIAPPSTEFAIPTSATLESVDHDALATLCPLLKSAYVESLRLDTGGWSFKIMRQDLVLAERGKEDADRFEIKKGTYAHIAHELHHTNPEYFDDPLEWKADRHIRYEDDGKGGKKAVVELGTVRPYGGGASMCKGRAFAQKEALIFTAVIISFYDMQAAGGGAWKIPRAKKATGTKTTNDDTRVWIRRRKFPVT